MPKYRVVVVTRYRETSEPIEGNSPEEAVAKARTFVDLDEKIVPEYVEVEEIHEVYEESEESPPPTWMVGANGELKRWK